MPDLTLTMDGTTLTGVVAGAVTLAGIALKLVDKGLALVPRRNGNGSGNGHHDHNETLRLLADIAACQEKTTEAQREMSAGMALMMRAIDREIIPRVSKTSHDLATQVTVLHALAEDVSKLESTTGRLTGLVGELARRGTVG